MMGYVCFHFNSCDCGNFMKIPQTVNMLNNALGGYRNLRHKHYLMNIIDKMYSTDLLTGLLNRRGFTSELDRMLRKNQPPFDVTYSYSFSAGGDAADDAEAAEETTEAAPDNNETAADTAETSDEAPAADDTQSTSPKTGNVSVFGFDHFGSSFCSGYFAQPKEK